MKTASQYAVTASSYSSGKKLANVPPHVLLNRIMGVVEDIKRFKCGTKVQKQKALDVCWDSYAKVLASIDPSKDESWGNAKERAGDFESDLPIIDDERLAHIVMYGSFDDDGAR